MGPTIWTELKCHIGRFLSLDFSEEELWLREFRSFACNLTGSGWTSITTIHILKILLKLSFVCHPNAEHGSISFLLSHHWHFGREPSAPLHGPLPNLCACSLLISELIYPVVFLESFVDSVCPHLCCCLPAGLALRTLVQGIHVLKLLWSWMFWKNGSLLEAQFLSLSLGLQQFLDDTQIHVGCTQASRIQDGVGWLSGNRT